MCGVCKGGTPCVGFVRVELRVKISNAIPQGRNKNGKTDSTPSGLAKNMQPHIHKVPQQIH